MALLTMKGHISRAMDFFNKESIYAAIGKSSKWAQNDCKELEGDSFDPNKDYDSYPPAPAITDDLLEVIGYKKIEFRSLVVQDDDGTLEYRGSKWKMVEPENALAEGARWIYLSTTLTYNELPTSLPYRQVGIYTGLSAVEGIPESQYVLLPEEVSDTGILEILDNRKPVYRDSDVRETIKLILEF